MSLLRFLPRFRDAYQALPALAEREGWTRDRIESYQLQRLNAAWQHAQQHCPYYQQLARTCSLPHQFDSLLQYRERMPLLTKAELLEHRDQLLSRQCEPGCWKRTSGSMGVIATVYWGHRAHCEQLRARYRFLQSWAIDFLDRHAFLWGHFTSFMPGWEGRVQRWRQPLEDWLRNRLRLSAYTLTPEVLRQYLHRLKAFRPQVLYSYSTAAYLLAQEAETCGLTVDSLRLIILTSEPAYPYMRQAIERIFRVPTAVEYGSVDCGLMATEGPDRQLRIREDLVFLESSPRPDDHHELLVTTLYNPSFPLFRYQIGDLTDEPIHRPERGFAVLHQVIGRNLDLLRSHSGAAIHPFYVEELFRELRPNLRRWQVHQYRDGSTQLRVQMIDASRCVDVTPLADELSRMLGYPVEVKIVDQIDSLPSGKFRYVISDRVEAVEWVPRGNVRLNPSFQGDRG